ncbi:MAG: 4-hydroxythreonine-4-phosphate dehydrogenase PdxA [Sulfurihydrogenibium sp.]|uniref:4-hydroxythreonine-4-phosphate dehydrogenase PdxA n=1 Tax=Sulfurihydrogenibium sp. TaxID=2053621 RepID=UPI003C7AFA0D
MVKVGISLGDPSGISPEILVKALTSKKIPKKDVAYIVYGSKNTILKTSKDLNINLKFDVINSLEEIKKSGFYLFNLYDKDFQPGKPSKESGKASVIFLENAVKDVLNKKTDGIVTLPISKKWIMESGFKYAGHTDYLADVSNTKDYVMALVCKKMKVGLITTHIPIKDVPSKITKDSIISKIKVIDRELKEKFDIKNPSIAVVGLNPHASDGGNIGNEEIEIITPALNQLKEEGINVVGPLSADTAFNRYKDFDIFVAMYHDQGLIPLKLLCFRKAVNITLGLPFIRTSPDHGTGYDIAGKNLADPSSLIESINTAVLLIKKRKKERL